LPYPEQINIVGDAIKIPGVNTDDSSLVAEFTQKGVDNLGGISNDDKASMAT